MEEQGFGPFAIVNRLWAEQDLATRSSEIKNCMFDGIGFSATVEHAHIKRFHVQGIEFAVRGDTLFIRPKAE